MAEAEVEVRGKQFAHPLSAPTAEGKETQWPQSREWAGAVSWRCVSYRRPQWVWAQVPEPRLGRLYGPDWAGVAPCPEWSGVMQDGLHIGSSPGSEEALRYLTD